MKLQPFVPWSKIKKYIDNAISGGGGGTGGATQEEHDQIYKNKDDIEQLNTDLGNYYNKSQTDGLLSGVGILSIKKATSFGSNSCLISGYGSDVTEGTVIYIDVMHEDIGRIGYAKLKKDTSGYSQYWTLVSSEYESADYTFSWGGQGYQAMARVTTKDGSDMDYAKIYGIVRSGSNLVNYSTEEQVIGTWIDGKPLYRKVIPMPESIAITPAWDSYNATKYVGSLNIKQAVRAIVLDTSSGFCNNARLLYSSKWYLSVDLDMGANETKVLIVEYTKTTD